MFDRQTKFRFYTHFWTIIPSLTLKRKATGSFETSVSCCESSQYPCEKLRPVQRLTRQCSPPLPDTQTTPTLPHCMPVQHTSTPCALQQKPKCWLYQETSQAINCSSHPDIRKSIKKLCDRGLAKCRHRLLYVVRGSTVCYVSEVLKISSFILSFGFYFTHLFFLYFCVFSFISYSLTLLIGALRYKPESRGFNSRWCQWKFSLT